MAPPIDIPINSSTFKYFKFPEPLHWGQNLMKEEEDFELPYDFEVWMNSTDLNAIRYAAIKKDPSKFRKIKASWVRDREENFSYGLFFILWNMNVISLMVQLFSVPFFFLSDLISGHCLRYFCGSKAKKCQGGSHLYLWGIKGWWARRRLHWRLFKSVSETFTSFFNFNFQKIPDSRFFDFKFWVVGVG